MFDPHHLAERKLELEVRKLELEVEELERIKAARELQQRLSIARKRAEAKSGNEERDNDTEDSINPDWDGVSRCPQDPLWKPSVLRAIEAAAAVQVTSARPGGESA